MKWDSHDPFTPWKHWLEPFYESGKLRIIGEIPLSYEEVEQLGWVCHLILYNNMRGGSDILYYDYPELMLTLMPKFAAYNTARDYWQAFADFLDVDKNALYTQERWHKCFVELAQARGFKVFSFADDPTPYVTSIRFQGGIPTYSLPDYFEKMVLPAVERSALRELPVKDALSYLLDHTYFVDSPVLDFLRNSGDLGVEFFSESCRLAKHALINHGEILSIDEVNLPEYVVLAFERFMEHREDVKQHWKKPFLQAAPYSEDTAVFLNLPEQEISLELSAGRLYWSINYPEFGITQERGCRVSRRRQKVVTQEDYLPIPKPMERIEVSLLAAREEEDAPNELRRWSLSLLPHEGVTPIVGFNEQGIQLASSRQLPAGVLYLLTPLGSELVFDGSGRKVEDCIPLVGEWTDWQMHCWDLSEAWSVMLAKDHQPLGDVVPVVGIIAQPDLVGGHLFQFQDLEEPLYTSDIPSIRVPLVKGSSIETRLSTWSLQVRSLGDANPSLNRTISLSEHAAEVEVEDNRGIFPLKNLLGEKPAGNYEIKASGPRGLGSEFRVRLWPKLMIQGHNLQLIKPAQNMQPMGFILRLQDGANCQLQPGAEGIDIHQTVGMWQVTVPAELNRALLELQAPADGGGTVRVPVSIPLPKLRWGLATDGTGDHLEFGQELIHRSIDQLLQAGSSSIHVEMYGLGSLIRNIKLRLVELDDEENVLQEASFFKTDFTKDWLRVTLGQFIGSIRAVKSSAQFELVYIPRDVDAEMVRIPLVEISHALDIREVALTQINETEWKLTWQEQRPLRNRRVMLLPAWQPWQKPWEYKIPNNARGQFTLQGIALPSARYHLYFYILPNYDSPLLKPPADLLPFIFDVCTPQERIETISLEVPSTNDRFKRLVELANIYYDIGNKTQCDNLLSQAAMSLIHITDLDLLIGTLECLRNKDVDKPIKSFFFNSMFKLPILESMLRRYPLNDPSLTEYLKYTATAKNIPSDSAKLLLRKVSDPIVIASCLKQLIQRKDGDLITSIVQMMRDSRLSRMDAIELLLKDPRWSIEKILELPLSPESDSLLSGILPKISQLVEYSEDPRVSEWMVRAIPYEEDEDIVRAYISVLYSVKHPKRFNSLMSAHLEGNVSEDEVMEHLSSEPKISLEALEQEPGREEYQQLAIQLIDKFPTIAGIVMPACQLDTPFGIAVIDFIEKWNNGRVNSIRLGEPDYRLNVVVGRGGGRIRVWIDYHSMTLTVDGETHVWKCGKCNYMHTRQDLVARHAERTHHTVVLTKIALPFSFNQDEVKVINEEG